MPRFARMDRALVVALVIGLSALTAQAQWQVQPIAALGAGDAPLAPPALTFDAQQRPHVAYTSNLVYSRVKHAYGSAGGAVAEWVKPTMPFGPSRYRPPVSLHMASVGDLVYLGYSAFESLVTPKFFAAVFDGTSWEPYAPAGLPASGMVSASAPAAMGGMVTDLAGELNWVLWYNPGSFFPDLWPTSPPWRYHVDLFRVLSFLSNGPRCVRGGTDGIWPPSFPAVSSCPKQHSSR